MKQTTLKLLFTLILFGFVCQVTAQTNSDSGRWVTLSPSFSTDKPIYDIKVNTKTKSNTDQFIGVIFGSNKKRVFLNTYNWKYNFTDKVEGSKQFKLSDIKPDNDGFRHPDFSQLGNTPFCLVSFEKNALLNNIQVLVDVDDQHTKDVSDAAYALYNLITKGEKTPTELAQGMKPFVVEGTFPPNYDYWLYSVSNILSDGLYGYEKNPELAFELVESLYNSEKYKNARSGFPYSLTLLARFYHEGVGVAPDKMKAMKILSEFPDFERAKLYFDLINNNLDVLGSNENWDQHICFCVAEKKLNEFLQGYNSNVSYDPIKEIMKYYCWSWNDGNNEAGKKFMEIRMVNKGGQSDLVKRIRQSPLYNEYRDTFSKPLYSILGPGKVWSDDPLVAYAKELYAVLQEEYKVNTEVAIKDMYDMINDGDWAWQALRGNWGNLRTENMDLLKLMSECGIEPAAELYEYELLKK